MDEELKVVTKGEFAPVAKEGYLFVTVEGPSIDHLNAPEAKQLAWAERLKHGFTNSMAGIEERDPPFIKQNAKADAPKVYMKTYRISPGF